MSKFIANSFQLPNAFVDEMLCKLSGNACKIYLLIVRKTRGWHKEADKISYSQIQKSTGINHRATVSKAIDELLEIGLISVQKGNEKSMSEYRLNDDFTGSKNEPVKNCTSSKNALASSNNEPAGSKNEQEAGSKNEHTEIHYIKNTRIKNTNTKDKGAPSEKFVKPTFDELKNYFSERGCGQADLEAQKFMNHYDSNGWMVGKTKMKNWQAAVRNWLTRNFGNPQPTSRMDELRQMASTNPTNVFVDDLPSDFQNYIGVNS